MHILYLKYVLWLKVMKQLFQGTGVRLPAGAIMGILLFATVSRPALGPTHSPIQWVPTCLSLGVKRPGREAEVKNAWSYTSTFQYTFMAWCSVLAKRQFYLTLLLLLLLPPPPPPQSSLLSPLPLLPINLLSC